MKAMKAIKVGIKLWLLSMLAGLIIVVPYIIVMGLLTVEPMLGLLILIPFILFEVGVMGWLILKYKRWLFK